MEPEAGPDEGVAAGVLGLLSLVVEAGLESFELVVESDLVSDLEVDSELESELDELLEA